MKSTRALIMIFFSLIAGGVAVWLAARWVGQQASENSTAVVVASKDLDPGSLLTPDMLNQVAWPNGSIPSGAFTELKKLETRVVAGSVIYKGEALLEAKLAPEGSVGGLSSIIPNGMRAISIHANEIVGVAGYIRPGSLVDIMVNTRDKNEKSISKIVLERILVLATAQDDKRDQNKPKVVSAVTLQVDPSQAEKIDLARSIGTLSLILRNPLDKAETTTEGARKDDLMAGDSPVKSSVSVVTAVKTAAARSSVSRPKTVSTPVAEKAELVEVIRGVQKANSNF
jgi:pilus assembly protein CpaB